MRIYCKINRVNQLIYKQLRYKFANDDLTKAKECYYCVHNSQEGGSLNGRENATKMKRLKSSYHVVASY